METLRLVHISDLSTVGSRFCAAFELKMRQETVLYYIINIKKIYIYIYVHIVFVLKEVSTVSLFQQIHNLSLIPLFASREKKQAPNQ